MELEKFELFIGAPFYDGEILNISINSQGYPYVFIAGKSHRLHGLVALKYIPNPDNLPCVDHKDDNKINYLPENLKWISYSDNTKKAYKNTPSMRLYAGSKKGVKPFISEKDGVIKRHESLRDAAKYLNRNVAAVHRCLNGEWSKCNGHNLQYV